MYGQEFLHVRNSKSKTTPKYLILIINKSVKPPSMKPLRIGGEEVKIIGIMIQTSVTRYIMSHIQINNLRAGY